jgi:hypothetical protein
MSDGSRSDGFALERAQSFDAMRGESNRTGGRKRPPVHRGSKGDQSRGLKPSQTLVDVVALDLHTGMAHQSLAERNVRGFFTENEIAAKNSSSLSCGKSPGMMRP